MRFLLCFYFFSSISFALPRHHRSCDLFLQDLIAVQNDSNDRICGPVCTLNFFQILTSRFGAKPVPPEALESYKNLLVASGREDSTSGFTFRELIPVIKEDIKAQGLNLELYGYEPNYRGERISKNDLLRSDGKVKKEEIFHEGTLGMLSIGHQNEYSAGASHHAYVFEYRDGELWLLDPQDPSRWVSASYLEESKLGYIKVRISNTPLSAVNQILSFVAARSF